MNELTIVYFDINGTITLGDQVNGKYADGVLQSEFSKKTVAQWSANSEPQSYFSWIRTQNLKRDEVHERVNNFVNWLPSWRDPKTGEGHPECEQISLRYQKLSRKMEGLFFVPAFTNFIERSEGRNYRLILRTFGKEAEVVAKKLKELYPSSQQIAVFGKFKNNVLYLQDQKYETAEKVDACFRNLDSHAAISDDFNLWDSNNRDPLFGKPFPGGPKRFFFDDNFHAINSMPLDGVSGEAFHVDPLEVVEDPDFFFNRVWKEG